MSDGPFAPNARVSTEAEKSMTKGNKYSIFSDFDDFLQANPEKVDLPAVSCLKISLDKYRDNQEVAPGTTAWEVTPAPCASDVPPVPPENTIAMLRLALAQEGMRADLAERDTQKVPEDTRDPRVATDAPETEDPCVAPVIETPSVPSSAQLGPGDTGNTIAVLRFELAMVTVRAGRRAELAERVMEDAKIAHRAEIARKDAEIAKLSGQLQERNYAVDLECLHEIASALKKRQLRKQECNRKRPHTASKSFHVNTEINTEDMDASQ